MADTMNVFCIVHGGDELYYLTNADFNDTLWAGLNDLPYQKLTAIGERTDIGTAAEIQQSGSCDYDITFDYDANTVKVEHYVKHYTQAFNWSELALVANALNEFNEFDNQTTFVTLDDVHLVYTTITDFEIPLQVSVDLVQKQIAYTLQGENDVLAKTDMYSSLKQIAESIENSAFDDWVTVYDLPADKICEYLEKNVEKMKMYDGTECFVIGKWTDTGIDGDIPVEFMIGAEYNFDKNDFDYYMQAYITDGDYKGYYLGENIYDHPIIKQDAVSALTDKIAEIAVDRNEARADGWNEDEELDLTLKDKGRT